VAALDSQNVKANFSNYGEKVDICAPGTQVYAPWLDTLYGWWDGTSFSAPFVAGMTALLISLNPDLTWAQLDSAIYLTAVNIDTLNPDYIGLIGAGLIDIVAALHYVYPISAGDINGDREINVLDISSLVNFLYKDGIPPAPHEAGDINGDIITNIQDITYLISFLYKDGPPPIEK
jgi:subtilisin family serine protease